MNIEVEIASIGAIAQRRAALMPPPVVLDPEHLAKNRIWGFGPANEHFYPYLMMRSNLLQHVRATGHQIIAGTSVEQGNGKTHTAINLAAALSRITPTILLELDLRRPTIGERLGLPDTASGVEAFLKGEATWHETRLAIQGSDLSVHRVGHACSNAEALLSSAWLSNAIQRIRDTKNRPVCIIDTPPALVGDDLALIARVVDGFLLVAQESRTRKRGLLEVVKALRPAPVIGSVLNLSITEPLQAVDYNYYYNQSPSPDAGQGPPPRNHLPGENA
jgi:protein-tyrosine kinase